MKHPALTSPHFPQVLAIGLLWVACAASAQSGNSDNAAPSLNSGVEQRFERIVLEDGGSRIQETRLGGTTKSIQVESKLGGQPYEVVPADANHRIEPGWNNAKDSVGKAQWRIGNF
jgi:hypothetical protein